VRTYVIPYEKGHVLIGRDFASQEIRGLAHFEDGPIAEAYRKNPDLDLHQFVADEVTRVIGREITRKAAKVLGLATMYGMGAGHCAELLGCSVDEAREVKAAYFKAFPSIKDLIAETSARGKKQQPIRTWGGREYYAEDPKIVNGRLRDFSYKMLNILVQGSSADLTKTTLVDLWDRRGDLRIYGSIHDEILGSVPRAQWRMAMSVVRGEMNKDRWDVPMRSSGYVGPNWGEHKATP